MNNKLLSHIAIVKLLIENDCYDTSLFSYDYHTKNVLYKNEEFEVKVEAVEIGLATGYEFSW